MKKIFAVFLLFCWFLSFGTGIAFAEVYPPPPDSTPPPPASCGDDSCGEGEDCYNCVQDCGSCWTDYCGDERCRGTENCSNCVPDCGACQPGGYELCGTGECGSGKTYYTYCSPNCSTYPRTCFDTPSCEWPPPHCGAGSCSDSNCPSEAHCPGYAGCGQVKCNCTGGNCFSDCSDCGTGPGPTPAPTPPQPPPPPYNKPPVCDNLSASPMKGVPPLDVNFTGTAHDIDGDVRYYQWDFDKDDDAVPQTTTSRTTSHEYSSSGNYTAKLRVQDNDLAWSNVCQTGPIVVNIPPTCTSLTAVALAGGTSEDPLIGGNPLEVRFTAEGADVDGNIVYYQFDFDGNGTWDRKTGSPTTTYTYETAGNYTAKVRVQDDDDDWSTTPPPPTACTLPIQVLNSPRVISVSPSEEWSGNPGEPPDGFHGDRNPIMFTTVFTDPDGVGDLKIMQINIASTMTTKSGWHLRTMVGEDVFSPGTGVRFYLLGSSPEDVNYGWGEGEPVGPPFNCIFPAEVDPPGIENDTAFLKGGCVSSGGGNLTATFNIEFKDHKKYDNSFPEGNWNQYLYVEDFAGNQDRIEDSLDMEIYESGGSKWYFHEMAKWGVDFNHSTVSTDAQSREDPDRVKVTINEGSGRSGVHYFWYKWLHEHETEEEVTKADMTEVEFSGESSVIIWLEDPGDWGRYLYYGTEDMAGNDNFDDEGKADDRFDAGGPWWQVEGGDIHADSGKIESIIPPTCIALGPLVCPYYLILDSAQGTTCGGDGCPGVGGSATGSVKLGMAGWRDYLSTEKWLTRTGSVKSTVREKADYDFYWRKLEAEVEGTWTGSGKPSGIVQSSGDITPNSTLNFNDGDSAIILHDGNITFDKNVTVDEGGFLAVITNGKITFGKDNNTQEAQGVFIANEIDFGTTDEKFEGEGTFVGWSNVDMSGRDFALEDEVDTNNTEPVISLKFRPDLVVNAPAELKIAFYPRWEEVIPRFGLPEPSPIPTPEPAPSPSPSPSPSPEPDEPCYLAGAPQTTGWGEGLYDCEGSDKRCYQGSCVTCAGFLYDDGCGGCAGQGGLGCWYLGEAIWKHWVAGEREKSSCTRACGEHGCVQANWNVNDVVVCRHFVSSIDPVLKRGDGSYAPSASLWGHGGWGIHYCYQRWSHSGQSCDATVVGAYRLCVCNY